MYLNLLTSKIITKQKDQASNITENLFSIAIFKSFLFNPQRAGWQKAQLSNCKHAVSTQLASKGNGCNSQVPISSDKRKCLCCLSVCSFSTLSIITWVPLQHRYSQNIYTEKTNNKYSFYNTFPQPSLSILQGLVGVVIKKTCHFYQLRSKLTTQNIWRRHDSWHFVVFWCTESQSIKNCIYRLQIHLTWPHKKGLLLWVMLSKPNYTAGGLLCIIYHTTEEIRWAGRGEQGLKEKLIPLGIIFSLKQTY